MSIPSDYAYSKAQNLLDGTKVANRHYGVVPGRVYWDIALALDAQWNGAIDAVVEAIKNRGLADGLSRLVEESVLTLRRPPGDLPTSEATKNEPVPKYARL